MSESNQAPGGTGWIVGVMVFIVGLIILLLVFVTVDAGRTEPTAQPIVARAGSAVVPTPTPLAQASDADATAAPVVLLPGRRVAAISPDGLGTRIYNSSALDALILDVYQDGAAFEVLEPGSDVAEYPVKNGAGVWYRVRASDGLVGWVIVDRLVPLESSQDNR